MHHFKNTITDAPCCTRETLSTRDILSFEFSVCDCAKPHCCSCCFWSVVQDLSKIKRHAIGHDKRNYTCDVCGKNFYSNHLQLNAHKKIHKDETRRKQRLQQRQQHKQAMPSENICDSPTPPTQMSLPASSSSPMSHDQYTKPDAFDALDANLLSSVSFNQNTMPSNVDNCTIPGQDVGEAAVTEATAMKAEWQLCSIQTWWCARKNVDEGLYTIV